MKKLLSNKWVEMFLLVCLIVGATLTIYTPEIPFIQNGVRYAHLILFSFLLVGLIFMMYDRSRLMFVSLGCCAALSLFLKNASNDRLTLPQANAESKISIIHLNTSNLNRFDLIDSMLVQYDPDIISVQELTPDWNAYLSEKLIEKYPFYNTQVRIDFNGMGMYSKLAMMTSDTFLFDEKPNLVCQIKTDQLNLNIFSSYVLSLSEKERENIKGHFNKIADRVQSIDDAVISLGEFNMVYWDSEIINFRRNTALKNSRSYTSEIITAPSSDHMFYSDQLECIQFMDLTDDNNNHLGILGRFQFKSSI